MRKRWLIIILSGVIIILATAFFSDERIINYLSGYLSKSEHVNANILLVEGWLPDNVLAASYEEFIKNGYDHIITTGINTSPAYFNIHSNGSLIFQTDSLFPASDSSVAHIVEVDAFSELGGDGRSHFNLFINNRLSGDFFAEKRKGNYRIAWTGDLSEIDSVTVQFDNDRMDESGDRNLYVRAIRVDQKIDIPYLNNSVYDILTSAGDVRMVNNIRTGAESARMRLIIAGIDSSLITAVPARKVKINRTLTSALAFRDWIEKSNIEVKGINIISMGPHSRRTWMTYSRVLSAEYDIGIISVPDNSTQRSPLRRVIRTLREAIGIIYYRIILMPY